MWCSSQSYFHPNIGDNIHVFGRYIYFLYARHNIFKFCIRSETKNLFLNDLSDGFFFHRRERYILVRANMEDEIVKLSKDTKEKEGRNSTRQKFCGNTKKTTAL